SERTPSGKDRCVHSLHCRLGDGRQLLATRCRDQCQDTASRFVSGSANIRTGLGVVGYAATAISTFCEAGGGGREWRQHPASPHLRVSPLAPSIMSHWTLVRNRNPCWVVLRVSHWQNRSAGGGAEATPLQVPLVPPLTST